MIKQSFVFKFCFKTSTSKFLWAAQTKKGTVYKFMKLHANPWNCMQAHGTSYKLRELHASSWTWMLAYVIACKLMDLHASLWTCMQAYGPACKLMDLHAFWNILKHSGMVQWCTLLYIFNLSTYRWTDRQKDRKTNIRTCRAAFCSCTHD